MLSEFGNICHIYFRDMGYFSKLLKGYGILGSPFQGLIIICYWYMYPLYVSAWADSEGSRGLDHPPLEYHKLLYVSLEILVRSRGGGIRLSMKYVGDLITILRTSGSAHVSGNCVNVKTASQGRCFVRIHE